MGDLNRQSHITFVTSTCAVSQSFSLKQSIRPPEAGSASGHPPASLPGAAGAPLEAETWAKITPEEQFGET